MNNNKLWFTFWPVWILANAISWSMMYLVNLMPFGRIAIIFVVGVFTGIFQWLVLRHFLDVDSGWIWVSILPYSSFIFIIYGLALSGNRIFYIAESLLIFAGTFGLLGLLQRGTLNQYYDHTWIWVLASPMAGFLALYLPTFFPRYSGINFSVFGLIYGFLSGIALIVIATIPVKKYFQEN